MRTDFLSTRRCSVWLKLTASGEGTARQPVCVSFDRPMLDALMEREQVRAERVRLG